MTTPIARSGTPGPRPDPEPATSREPDRRIVDPRGRSKVHRWLSSADRDAAVAGGLEAYARGAFYLAHEELEPAWMAAEDPGERELLGGLIKLAAAYVHAVRGNPAGVTANLRGARERFEPAAAAGSESATRLPALSAGRVLDVPALLIAIDDRLARVAALPSRPAAPAGTIADPPHDVAGPAGRARRASLDLAPLPLPWSSRP